MPIISANILSGRTKEQRANFVREVTEAAVRTLGVEHQQVRVMINEIAPENWGTAGVTKAASEGGA